MSRLSQLAHNFVGTTYDLTLGFSHNPAGQIAANTRSNDLYSYTGHANQNVTDTVNGLNQATATGTTAIGHDARGNINAIGTSSYGYTSENLLASVPGNVNYCYDGLGRFYSYGWTGSCSGIAWLQDGWNTAAEYLDTGTLIRWNVYGPENEMLAVIVPLSGGGLRYSWNHGDERGSLIGASREDGTFQTALPVTYDEYGRTGGAQSQLGLGGERYLPGTTFLYLRHRNYNRDLGRFMQTDPIGYDGGMNLYAYVRNDPVNLTDPSGLSSPGCSTTAGSVADVCGSRGGIFSGGGGGGRGGGAGGGPRLFYEQPLQAGDGGPASEGGGEPTTTCSTPNAFDWGTFLHIVVAGRIGILALPLLTTSSTTSEFVVRAGVAAPENLLGGSSTFVEDGVTLTGFSASSAPGMTVDEIAFAARYYRSGQISYTTRQTLQSHGYNIVATPRAGNPIHVTVIVPQTFNLLQATQLSNLFQRKANPARDC